MINVRTAANHSWKKQCPNDAAPNMLTRAKKQRARLSPIVEACAEQDQIVNRHYAVQKTYPDE